MQYNNDERNGCPDYGNDPSIIAESYRGLQSNPSIPDRAPPAGAPAERTDAPVLDSAVPARRVVPVRVPEQVNEQVSAPRADAWREPSYSQRYEPTADMYTPGICVDRAFTRKRNAEARAERKPRERSGRFGLFMRAACLMLVCVILSGAAAYGVMEYRFNRGDFTVVNQVVLGGTNNQQGSGMLSPVASTGTGISAEDIYDLARTHVVGIVTEMVTSGSFGMQNSTPISSGSGFIISSDGYILTNYHVIETAHLNGLPLKVNLSDGTSFDAMVIGYETSNDFAVIKIDANGLNPAVIGNSDNIRVGQRVYAVGNPFGNLIYTMTDGIVSALDRTVTVEGKNINTFQFSAAVNSGNSGGPVYDANGEVIGIVTAKLTRDSGEGIGFAIPINDAIEIASELIEHGYITGRPFMGITVETVTRANADYFDWVVGAYVRSVEPGSAAETAGMEVGDIIIKLNDVEISSLDELLFAMRRYRAGDTTTITVWRVGEEFELTITFDENLSAGQARQPERLDPHLPQNPRQSPTP